MNHHPVEPRLTQPRRRAAAIATALCVLAACGGGGLAVIIPLFEFIFGDANLVYQGVTYTASASFSPANPTTSTGSFTSANLSANDGNAVFLDYQATGTYDGCDITLNIGNTAQAPIAASYLGHFTSNDTLLLTPVNSPGLPPIHLLRNPLGTRQMGCH